jgi:hypothetical protein
MTCFIWPLGPASVRDLSASLVWSLRVHVICLCLGVRVIWEARTQITLASLILSSHECVAM